MQPYLDLLPLTFAVAAIIGISVSVIFDARKARLRGRREALAEAAASLKSLSLHAYKSGRDSYSAGNFSGAKDADTRGYFFNRASEIVNSIPKERLS